MREREREFKTIERCVGVNKPIMQWKKIFIIGLFTPTHLSIVLNSLSLSLTFSSCEPLLFDYLMCTAAVVTPESHQILVSLSDTLSRLSPTI